MKCRECANWRDVNNGECRAHPPGCLPLPVQPGLALEGARQMLGLQVVSFWPPVEGDSPGCAQFKPALNA